MGQAPVECASLSPSVNSTGQGDDPGEMHFASHLHEFHGVKVLGDDDRETNDKNNKRPFVIASTLTYLLSYYQKMLLFSRMCYNIYSRKKENVRG